MLPRAAALRAASLRSPSLFAPSASIRSYANFVGSPPPPRRRPRSDYPEDSLRDRRSTLASASISHGQMKIMVSESLGWTIADYETADYETADYETAEKATWQIEEIEKQQQAATSHLMEGPEREPAASTESKEAQLQVDAESERGLGYDEQHAKLDSDVPPANVGVKCPEAASKDEANPDLGRKDDPSVESETPPPLTKPLPDLRQGIPSTFTQEFDKTRGVSQEEGHDPWTVREAEEQEKEANEGTFQQSTGSGRGDGGRDFPKSAYETSTDRRRNRLANWGFAAMASLGLGGAVYLGRDWDTAEEAQRHPDIPSGWGLGIFWDRIQARINDSMGYYTEPTFPKLLPDCDQSPPYTLVLSLEDLLIHSEWTRQHGYRTAKRPGLDYFIRYLSQYYEIVLFTSLPVAQAEPVLRKLDPYRMIVWPLFREATRYHKGEYIKDLKYLNRDPSKVIFMDTKAAHVQANPENAIILAPWRGDPKDRDLVSYIPFLESVAALGVPDVRAVLASFDGKHIPAEYAAREGRAREAFNKALEERKAKRPRNSAGGWFAGAFGMKAGPAPGAMMMEDGSTVSEGFEKGMMLTDQIRENGRKGYEHVENMIRNEGAKWLKDMEEEEKKMQAESLKSMKGGVAGWFGGLGGVAGWFGGLDGGK